MSYKNKAERVIAQGALTNSKHWMSYVEGVYPTHIKSSNGPYLIDEDNKKYLDFAGGLGTNLLGYGFPLVENEVTKYRYEGKSPSLPHILEVDVAIGLKGMFTWVDKWKFLKTGSEACSAAIKIARSYTGRDLVLSEGYHGWSDDFVSLTPPADGVPKRDSIAKYTGQSLKDVACVIVEPVMLDDSEERIAWLRELREQCTFHGAMLIFDEVITGFRYKDYSVSKAYSIEPDLIIIGKAMANGYALAAVGGKSKIMDCDYFVSSTYAGELSSLAACKGVMDVLKVNPNYALEHLINAGRDFTETFNKYAKPLDFEIKGYPTRGYFVGSEYNIALFFQEACLAGLLFGKSWFISMSHINHLSGAIKTCQDILTKQLVSPPKLKGKMPTSPFAARVRDGK